MILKAFFATFILTSISLFGNCQIQLPSEFVETIPPEYGSGEWCKLNRSHAEFGVEIVKGEVKVLQVKEKHKDVLKIANGKLVGVDNGEWGGNLTYVPNDTTKKRIEIKSGNIKFIFKFKNKIYFVEGLAHQGINEGALYELNTSANKFTYQKIIDFEDAPEAYSIHNDKIFIVSFQNFYVIQNLKKELIFKDTF